MVRVILTHGRHFEPAHAASDPLHRDWRADAARRLLRRNNVNQLTFPPGTGRVDEQLYDGIAAASIAPRRASLHVVIRSFGQIAIALPRVAESGEFYRGLDFDGMDCEQRAGWR